MDKNTKDIIESLNFIKDNMAMQSEVTELRTDMTDLRTDMTDLRTDMTAGFATLDKRLDGVESRLVELSEIRHDLDTLAKTLKNVTSVSVLEDLRNTVRTLTTRVDKLELTSR